jgi:hypothetical protein
VPLRDGEIVGLACMRDLIEDQADDLSILRDQLYHEQDKDEDAGDVAMASFYFNVATDYIDRILHRHDRPREEREEKPYTKYSSCTDLVLREDVVDGILRELETVETEKKLTEMTPSEIGEGTVLFDPKGEAWVVNLWTDTVMDLKQGHVTKANVKPKDLDGWTFDGISFDDKIAGMVEEIVARMENPSAGIIAAEIAMKEKSMNHPLRIIKQVNKVLEAA